MAASRPPTDQELTTADGHRFTAHRAEPVDPPADVPLGGVVVVQEIFGVNAHIRSVADRFAAAGYLALAPRLFDRLERGVELAYDAEGVTRGQALAWDRLPIADAVTDVAATADALAAELGGAGRVGVVGFCFGGMVAAAAAARIPDRIGAAVAYYPSLAAQLLVDDVVRAPLLVHLGDTDQRVTVADGETLRARWPEATYHRYHAGHGFNCDLRPGYDAPAAALAWDRTLAFLAHHLAPDAAPR